jgi:hypothetical protein
MIDQQPLAALHDIVAAPAASWWPLAPGWYAAALLVLLMVVLSSRALWHYYQRRRLRKLALRALRLPFTDFNAITLTLKQACLGYFDPQQIARLSGPQWFAFLQQQLPSGVQAKHAATLEQLQQTAYQPSSAAGCELYQGFARLWLRHALPPRSNRHD